MNYRVLGKTGVKVSEVGLGTWQLGNADWGVLDDAEAMAILYKAVDSGVNFFDTADVYGLGVSERLIGKFLKESKAKVHVSTKLCRVEWVKGDCEWPRKYTLAMARKACQRSCKNLGVDALFLQQWHCPPTDWLRSGELFDHMATLKKEGLVRNWGCSVESVEEGLIAMTDPGCATLQVILNLFRQKLVTDLLPIAKRRNVGILARVPLASGLLTGKFKRGHTFAEGDHRNYNADGKAFNVGETFAGLPFAKGVALSAKAKRILKPTAVTPMAALALRWILDHDAVSAVIPGASRPSHVESNAAASRAKRLGPAKHEALRELYEREVASAIRGPY